MEEKTLATSKQNYWLAVLLAWGIPELFGFYLYFIVDEFPEDEVIRYQQIEGRVFDAADRNIQIPKTPMFSSDGGTSRGPCPPDASF